MQLSLIAGLSLFACAQAHLWDRPAVKLVKTKENVASNYTWTVTDWNAHCAASGCFSDFNVSAAAWDASVPAFSASCSVGPEGAAYQHCSILDDGTEAHLVSARLQAVNATGTDAHLAVSYEFSDTHTTDTYWNYTAYAVEPYHQAVTGSAKFSMTPSEIWGAA